MGARKKHTLKILEYSILKNIAAYILQLKWFEVGETRYATLEMTLVLSFGSGLGSFFRHRWLNKESTPK